MRIATWNVNSIRAREERLVAWLERHEPDVLCLQELKVEAPGYPRERLAALGYVSAINAQKTYNGVAILSRHALSDVEVGLEDGVEDPQARLVAATVRGVRVVSVYVPNGQTVGSDKWAYKLAWLARLRDWLGRRADPHVPLAVCGDYNVAPEAVDVHDPAEYENDVLFHPEARAALGRLLEWGLVDPFREARPAEPNLYSWWDYRMLGFPKNRGLRIDYALTTRPLAERHASSFIDREERKGKAPSDHAPVVYDFHD